MKPLDTYFRDNGRVFLVGDWTGLVDEQREDDFRCLNEDDFDFMSELEELEEAA